MTNFELNQQIANYMGDVPFYDLRCEFRIINPDLTLEEAERLYEQVEPEYKHLYSITTSRNVKDYSGDIGLAITAAFALARSREDTFVLSGEEGSYKACYGGKYFFSEKVGTDLARLICEAIIGYIGKV